MGKRPGALGSRQDAVGTPRGAVSFPAAPEPWGRVVKIVIGASGQGASFSPARRETLCFPVMRTPRPSPPPPKDPVHQSEYLMLLIENDLFLDAHQRSWH